MKNHKPKSKLILEELSGETMNPQTSPIVLEQVEEKEHNDEEIPLIKNNRKSLIVVEG